MNCWTMYERFFYIKDFKLHNKENKVIMVELIGKFNDLYESLGTGFVLDSDENDYNTFIVMRVIGLSDEANDINVGDKIVTKMAYLLSIKDIFEGYTGEFENNYVLPERLVSGVMND